MWMTPGLVLGAHLSGHPTCMWAGSSHVSARFFSKVDAVLRRYVCCCLFRVIFALFLKGQPNSISFLLLGSYQVLCWRNNCVWIQQGRQTKYFCNVNLWTVVSCQWFTLSVVCWYLRAWDLLVCGLLLVVYLVCNSKETGVVVREVPERCFVIWLLEGWTDKLRQCITGRGNAGCLHFKDVLKQVKDLEWKFRSLITLPFIRSMKLYLIEE